MPLKLYTTVKDTHEDVERDGRTNLFVFASMFLYHVGDKYNKLSVR